MFTSIMTDVIMKTFTNHACASFLDNVIVDLAASVNITMNKKQYVVLVLLALTFLVFFNHRHYFFW